MPDSSRRNFLIAGLAVPAAASATRTADEHSAPPRPPLAAPRLGYRILGDTGLKVTSVGFGCMITSDASVIERAADIGITYFDIGSRIPKWQQRAHGGRGAQGQAPAHHAIKQERR